MKIYVISDLHFGHKGIIKLCNRPFKTVEEMDKVLIDNWNSVVDEDDLVYVLGDFAFKGKKAEDYLDKLNGRIILVRGNHDKYIKHKKLIKVVDYLKVEVEGVVYILSHYPMTSWDGQFKNSIHLYGHIHNGSDVRYWEKPRVANAHNVSCEVLGYMPRDMTTFKPLDFVSEMFV